MPKTSFVKTALVAAGLAVAIATPAFARGGEDVVVNIGKDRDLLEWLIELDQSGIEDMRADMAEARVEISRAIADIEDARADMKDMPGGRFIINIAFATARASASTAIDEALVEARIEIDRAEDGLAVADVSADEKVETQGAIDVLRSELDEIEVLLEGLLAALRT